MEAPLTAKSNDSGSEGFIRSRGFAVDLFEVGDPLSCVFAFSCAPCALAASRSSLDNSSALFNCVCLPICCLPTSRWLIRTAYDLDGSAEDDCLVSLLFPCCTINQLYQTALKYGTDGIDGGVFANDKTFHANEGACCFRDDIYNVSSGLYNGALCCYSYFCCPCAAGEALSDSMGMPWLMGACCVTPCATRNLLRYHYRIAGDDLMELALPTVLSLFLYGISTSILALLVIPGLMLPQVYIESKNRGKSEGSRYLRLSSASSWARFPRGDRNNVAARSGDSFYSEQRVRDEERQHLLYGVGPSFSAPGGGSSSRSSSSSSNNSASGHSFSGLPILANLRMLWSRSTDVGEMASDDGSSIPSLHSGHTDHTKGSSAYDGPLLGAGELGAAGASSSTGASRSPSSTAAGDGGGGGGGLPSWGSPWGSSARMRREERERALSKQQHQQQQQQHQQQQQGVPVPVAHDVALAQRWHEDLQRADASYEVRAGPGTGGGIGERPAVPAAAT